MYYVMKATGKGVVTNVCAFNNRAEHLHHAVYINVLMKSMYKVD